MRPRISIRGSVRPSVRPLRLLENRSFRHFSAAKMSCIKSLGYSYIRTSFDTMSSSVCPSKSSAKVNTRRDTVRTHRCLVRLVYTFFFMRTLTWTLMRFCLASISPGSNSIVRRATSSFGKGFSISHLTVSDDIGAQEY